MSAPNDSVFVCSDMPSNSLNVKFNEEPDALCFEVDEEHGFLSWVYLDREQVQGLRDQLTGWLEASK